MDSIQIMFYASMVIVAGFAAFQMYKIKKSGKFDATTYETVKALAYDAMNETVELNKQKQISREVFINGIIALMRNKIIASGILSESDKKFWTEEKLQALFMPMISVMMDRIDKQLKK